MAHLLGSILPILIALSAGWCLARFVNESTRKKIASFITPFVWLLLFSIGYEFGNVLSTLNNAGSSIGTAFIFAALTTGIPWLILARLGGVEASVPYEMSNRKAAFSSVAGPLKECLIALIALASGVVAFHIDWLGGRLQTIMPSTTHLLYGLVMLVGLDLYGVRPDTSWYSLRTLKIPCVVVIGSLIGGGIASFVIGAPLALSLALSSGFGWFTLSGILVGQQAGDAYGVVALLTDLFREFMAIALMYSLGSKNARQCIAAGGATSLDSTLPIIKKTCSASYVPLALVSGFVLTVLAPFMMSFFLILH
ncbi:MULTISPECIES: lysine exporter LysO family protein [Pseudomonas]|uniref:Lysine exporter LysO family protein n=1 Tax=Pseudomonas salomonii TaxID=191391 RepID=A0A7Y8GBU0_9PSED|nr:MULTISPECIES: lysine exporter LysO family protein [Pseudomonas]NWF07128.1 lysine exporter LysO family protein [Pseudomonas salomonii]OPA90577.1 hypothetical protein BFW86_11140 [Pseudomonas fluorescens]